MSATGRPARRLAGAATAAVVVVALIGIGAWFSSDGLRLLRGPSVPAVQVVPARATGPAPSPTAPFAAAPADAGKAEGQAGAVATTPPAPAADDAHPQALASTGAPSGTQSGAQSEAGKSVGHKDGDAGKDGGGGAPARPQFDVVVVDPHGAAVLAGRAAPGADVAVLDDGREIGHTRADGSGQWVILPDKPLAPGGQQLALRENLPGGGAVAGDTPAAVVVPGQAATAPGKSAASASGSGAANSAPGGGEPAAQTGPVAVLLPPAAPARLLPPATPGHAPPSQVAVLVADYDANGALELAGVARPGTTVRLYVDDVAAGDAAVDAGGQWQLAVGSGLAPGPHRLRADDLGPGGHVLSRVELPFMRQDLAAAEAREGRVVVQPRQTLWAIARHIYGHGTRYTVIFDANRDQIRNPDRIYIGQVFTLPQAAPDATQAGAAR